MQRYPVFFVYLKAIFMIKTIFSLGLLGIILLLTSCIPTAVVVGTSYEPIHYTYAPGFNPPQVAYPDVPTDIGTSIEEPVIVINRIEQ